MVIGERKVCHITYSDKIFAIRGSHYFCAFFDGSDTKYRNLRLIDDRRAEKPAKNARIRDGECPALNLVRVKFLCSCTIGKIVCRNCKFGKRKVARTLYHRHDQAPIEGNCHTEINITL